MKAPAGFSFKKPYPYKHQLEALAFASNKIGVGILDEMGLGKTRTAIDIARYRIQFDNVERVLVVCPLSIIYNWKKEIEKFSEYNAAPIVGTKDKKYKTIATKNCKFFIINYESLKSMIVPLAKKQFDMIIFDESARFIKNPLTTRTKASMLLADHARYKIILTGTPIANYPIDIWAQFRVLDGGRTFGKNFYRFRNTYFYTAKIGPIKKFLIRKDRIKYLTEKIESICIRRKKEECVDLPEQIFSVIELEMDSLVRRTYLDILKKTEIDVKNDKVTITNILTRLLRLQQVTSGFIKGDDGKIYELEEQPKLDALINEVELIIDAKESVIIWCRFLKSIEMIENRLNKLKIKTISMSGLDKDKYSKWSTFQKSKTRNVFVGQVESGGLGIELFKNHDDTPKNQHTIFYENTWSLDTRLQAQDRVHRVGQKSITIYKDIVIRETIDELILKAIHTKKSVADFIIDNGVDILWKT